MSHETCKNTLSALLILVLLVTSACDETPKVSRMGGVLTGLTNQPTALAAEMYPKVPLKNFGSKAQEYINIVDKLITDNSFIYEKENNKIFTELTPYRETKEVQAAISRWAKIRAKGLKKPYKDIILKLNAKNPNALQDWAARNGIDIPLPYHAPSCREIVKAFPYSVDARNNMVFVLLKGVGWSGYHPLTVMAQMELETIIEITEGDYYPAAINLTYVLEINGQLDRAQKLAYASLEKWADIPQVRYNAAWYKFHEDKLHEAKELLKPIVEVSLELGKNKKGRPVEQENFYKELYDIVDKTIYARKPIWEVGINEKYMDGWDGLEIFDFYLPWSTVLFLLALTVVGGIFFRLLEISDILTVLGLLALQAVWIIWWGYPEDLGGWIGFLINPFLGSMLGALTSPDTWD